MAVPLVRHRFTAEKAQKMKRSIPTLNSHAYYEAKARYYERYSTQELLDAGYL